MAIDLLGLPAELRLMIYDLIFVPRVMVVDAGTQEDHPSLLPAKASYQPRELCSAQILRVCKQLNHEATPYLYGRTHFFVLTQAFAGKLPFRLSSGTVFASKIKSLTWQLSCDMMKHFYDDDFSIASHDLKHLDVLELRCQAENWRNSFCGEWADREAFVRGRNQMIQYAQRIQGLMNKDSTTKAMLIENQANLGRGRVILRLSKIKQQLAEDELLIL